MAEPPSLALVNCNIYTGADVLSNHSLVIKRGLVDSTPYVDDVPPGVEVVDLEGQSVSPGFLDLQVNGGGDVLFNDDPSPDALVRIRDAHRRCGTTDLMPTFITGPASGMSEAVTAVNRCLEERIDGILGLHFEGPALNPAKAGVHDPQYIGIAPVEELALIYTSVVGGATLVTLAPEVVPSGFVRLLCEHGVRVSAGHTNATFAQMMDAFAEGLSCGTHLWNAMSSVTAREPGVVGALVIDDRAWFGIIGDGAHVDMNTLALSLRAKRSGRAFLVSDALSPVGGVGSSFLLGPTLVQVANGVCVSASGKLAGSCCDLATGVRNCVQRGGIALPEALRMASLYPARYLGVDDRRGWIRPGYAARLVVLDEQIRVSAVVIDGVVHRVEQAGH